MVSVVVLRRWCRWLALVGLLLFQAILGLGERLRWEEQEKLMNSLGEDYQLVTPFRLDSSGDKLASHATHFRRRRRALEEEDDESVPFGEHTGYLIQAFGLEFELNLRRYDDFLSGDFTLEYLGGDNVTNFLDEGPIADHCYYSGSVNNGQDSLAVVSICDGIFGTFRTEDGVEYYVEPIYGNQTSTGSVGKGTLPHLVYEQSALSRQKDPKSLCGVTDHANHNSHNSRSRKNRRPNRKHRQRKHNKNDGFSHSTSTSFYGQNRDHDQHSRHKRFVSLERNVEVMVVADSKMVLYHRRDLEHYILTLMAIVNKLYKNPSIGQYINIVVSKLVLIENPADGPSVSANGGASLRNFCLWQQSQNTANNDDPGHFDTALLITRHDICKSATECETLGLAELGTMCNRYRSCSITEDNGLSAAFTIAHELGHVFNMPHDDDFTCKSQFPELQLGKYHIMASTLNYQANPWTWSRCSNNRIEEFLRGDGGNCLLNKPRGHKSLPHHLPGEHFDANKQCQLTFGRSHQVCPFMTTCKRLWCMDTNSYKKLCKTQHMPWADGSSCGANKWCQKGECAEKTSYRLQPVNGAWSRWGPYGACSRSCDGGVKFASRKCDNPVPKDGGKFCVGKRIKYRSCHTKPCPGNPTDFREEQCATHNGQHFNINGLPPQVEWVPKYTGVDVKDRCKLYCRAKGTSYYYRLSNQVEDGTTCTPDTDDICVHGICKKAGCDHMLGSDTKRDECGVCGGDGTSCETFSDSFNQARYGYNTVTRIPEGARNIVIEQRGYLGRPDDDNYLALMNSRSEYVLNGHYVVSMFAREVEVAGTVMTYSGSNAKVETLNCSRAIREDLILQVLSVGSLNPPDISYHYTQPIANIEVYVWDVHGPWKKCSSLCQGSKQREVLCLRNRDREGVPEHLCQAHNKPDPIIARCATRCSYRWQTVQESGCSVRCGQGQKSLTIRCVKNENSQRRAVVANSYCQHLAKPKEYAECQVDCPEANWQYGPWSQCSASCNGGTQSRFGACVNRLGQQASPEHCDSSTSFTVQPCNEQACPILAQWSITSDWSECSVTCGNGYQDRQVACMHETQPARESQCEPSQKPSTVQDCRRAECPAWQFSAWSRCSVTCGQGHQQRMVRCVTLSGHHVDPEKCNPNHRPGHTQYCYHAECPRPTTTATTTTPPTTTPATTTTVTTTTTEPPPPPPRITSWRTGGWTLCSATCGLGTRERYVSCRTENGNYAEEYECSHLTKPVEQESCQNKPCPVWRTGEWQQCPVRCGTGKTTRYVACVLPDDQLTNSAECNHSQRPVSEMLCNTQVCLQPDSGGDDAISTDSIAKNTVVGQTQWRTGPWGQCSTTCGQGWRQRAVLCRNENGEEASACDQATKPTEQEQCATENCPQWNYGDWSQCSVSCGSGSKTRQVVCQRPSGLIVSDHDCAPAKKPQDQVPCNAAPCPASPPQPYWHKGAWSSPCSATCGKGTRHRMVTCVNAEGHTLNDRECPQPKPRQFRGCRDLGCPKWKAVAWSECSATCGRGVRTRLVKCKEGQRVVNPDRCQHKTKPQTVKNCTQDSCQAHQWKPGPWTKCTRSCGGGQKQRLVQCTAADGSSAPDQNCADQPPANTMPCNTRQCHIKAHWKKGDWDQCSQSCGGGERQRLVECVDHSGEVMADSHCKKTQPKKVKSCNRHPCPKNLWTTGDWSECSQTCGQGVQSRSVSCQTFSKEGHPIPGEPLGQCDPETKPSATTPCNMGQCNGFSFWRTGRWTQCSTSCGNGVRQRKVMCLSLYGENLPDYVCQQLSEKPASLNTCNHRSCLPLSCREVQQMHSVYEDGEHLLLVRGRTLKVHCHHMRSSTPTEYIALLSAESENYSEIYSKRLIETGQCPYNGNRNDACECHQGDYSQAGLVTFSKLRIDIATMTIITEDSTFSRVKYGGAVPVGVAGDCYSSANCPQGRFNLDLTGTGLAVSPQSQWLSEGANSVANIHRVKRGQIVRGRCGGFLNKLTEFNQTDYNILGREQLGCHTHCFFIGSQGMYTANLCHHHGGPTHD